MTTAQLHYFENWGEPRPIIDQFDKLGILPHTLPNAIGMWPNEQECLVWCALQCNPNIAWWEIGSFCGGSTVLLGMTQIAIEGEGLIYAVDPNPKPMMELNINRAKLNNQIVKCKTTSNEALSRNNDPISFLFLDGWHSFSAVLSEFELAKPHLADNAIIAFHDVSPVLKECEPSYIKEKLDYVTANLDMLLQTAEQDFRIDEAVVYICKKYNYEIVDIPVRKHINHKKETGTDCWIRGETSPYNAFIAIREKK